MNFRLGAPFSSAFWCSLSLLLSVAACSPSETPLELAVQDLAPTGTLRAAINVGNPILAHEDLASGELRGLSVDLSRELAARLGVPLELLLYRSAGAVVQDATTGAWDVAYNAIDPTREEIIRYTAPYLTIAGAYLVRDESSIRVNTDVDRDDTTVVVATGSAYDLFLTRELQQAELVRVPTSPEVVDRFLEGSFDVAAGVRQQLEADADRIPGLRLFEESFMEIRQAMAIPRSRGDAGANYVEEFIEDMKSLDAIAEALARYGIEGVSVVPPSSTH